MPIFRDDPYLESKPKIWGPGLFDNDTAIRVRNCYLEYLMEGRPDHDATRLTIEERDIDVHDMDTDLLFWTALAWTQCDVHRLEDSVAKNTLELISGPDCHNIMMRNEWASARAEILDNLRQRIEAATTVSYMSDKELVAYCKRLWGDGFQNHVDPE